MNTTVPAALPNADVAVKKKMKMIETKIQMEHADETAAMAMDEHEAFSDRQHFAINIGILLHQTRKNIKSIYLTKDDVAHVVYDNNTERQINVDGDSYQGMILDIVSRI